MRKSPLGFLYFFLCVTSLLFSSCSPKITFDAISKGSLSSVNGAFFISAEKSGMSFDTETETIRVGDEIDLFFVDDAGSVDNEKIGATWRSQGNVGVLSIQENGINSTFRATKVGVSTIFAQYDGNVKSVTITIINSSPKIDNIADQLNLKAGLSINQINASDDGLDVDVDGDILTYTCHYDSIIDSDVSSLNSCATITGLTFSSSTGVMNWTSSLSQIGDYEFKISASDGSHVANEIFRVQIVANASPVLDTISNQTGIVEGSSITQINANDSGDDLDADGEPLSYSCYYDLVVDGAVLNSTSCSSISGVNFNPSTGLLDWLTQSSQAGIYEFKIVGSDGLLENDQVFTLQILSDQSPVIDNISDLRIAKEGVPIAIDANDGGDDLDGNGDVLNYSCTYDTTEDDSVVSGTDCTSLVGVSFSSSTGEFNWTPSSSQYGKYEFQISASDGGLSDTEIFVIGVLDPSHFTMVWRVPIAGDVITLPLVNGFNYNFTVDWGDGSSSTVTSYSDIDKNHTYTSAGDYVVTLVGSAERIGLNNSGNDRFKLISIPYLGNLNYISLEGAFYGAENLEYFAGGTTSSVTTMSNMFRNCNSLSNIDLSTFDTSNVSSMSGMFYDADGITNLDLSSFVTTSLQDMSYMFYQAENIATLDISSFDTSSVTDLTFTFRGMSDLASLDLSNFNTANVLGMSGAFAYMTSLTSLDLSSFNTSNVTSMGAMFEGSSSLTSLDVSSFNTSSVTAMSYMFTNVPLSSLDLSHFNTSQVTGMVRMFSGMSNLTSLNISNFNTM